MKKFKVKDIGIEMCANPKDVKVFLHPKSIKMWLTIAIMVVALSGTGMKMWDGFWYDFLKYPRNTEEKVIKHMTYNHLVTGEVYEDQQIMKVRKKTCQMVTTEYSDGCIVTALVNEDGRTEKFNVFATEQTIAMLAKGYRVSIVRETEAGGYARKFDFKFHAGDRNYYEKRGGYRGEIVRTYLDEYRCALAYIIDDRYGNTYGWHWFRYDNNHNGGNN